MKKGTTELTTSKKVKYVGVQKFINADTGEVEEFSVNNIEERDFNFSKIWMKNFIMTLDLVGNQKTRLAMWIIDNLNRDNQLICTFRRMSEQTGLSLDTVRLTMKILQEADFLRKIGNGVYVVNPNTYFKGTRQARLNILNQYQEIGYEPPKLTDEEKIQRLESSISILQKELEKLKHPKVIDTQIEGQMELMPDGTIVERATDERAKGADK